MNRYIERSKWLFVLPSGNQIADLGTYTRTDGSSNTGAPQGVADMCGRGAAQQWGDHRPTPCGCNLVEDTQRLRIRRANDANYELVERRAA